MPSIDKADMELCSPICVIDHSPLSKQCSSSMNTPLFRRDPSSCIHRDCLDSSKHSAFSQPIHSLKHMKISIELTPQIKEEELCPAFMRGNSFSKDSDYPESQLQALPMKSEAIIQTIVTPSNSKWPPAESPVEPVANGSDENEKQVAAKGLLNLDLSAIEDDKQELSANCINDSESDKHSKKKAYTADENKMLLKLVHIYGEKNWSKIAELMPGRNRKQLRDHYVNFLKKKLERTEFSAEEDDFIVSMVKKHGHSWKKIADALPGRAPIMIKNRYNSKLKRKKRPVAATTTVSCEPSCDKSGNVSKGILAESYAEDSSKINALGEGGGEKNSPTGQNGITNVMHNVTKKIGKLYILQHEQ